MNKSETGFLREMLYEAIFIPEGSPPLPKSIVEEPALRKYFADWGKPGDIAVIAEYKGQLIGAIWSRLYPETDKGFGFIDKHTPELSIAVRPEYRDRGIGTSLFKKYLSEAGKQGFREVSLSVDKRNRSVSLYRRMGFEIVREPEADYTMRKHLPTIGRQNPDLKR